MAAPSLAEALDGYEAPEAGHGGGDAEMFVADLAKALGIKNDKAQEVYDIICAIVEAKGSGAVTITVE